MSELSLDIGDGRGEFACASDRLKTLLERVALKDRCAFEAVYDHTCARLLRVAIDILHREEWADEVLQEVYMSVWHNAAKYDSRLAKPMTWLINIARNRAIDLARQLHTECAATVAMHDDHADIVADLGAQPEQQLQRARATLRIERVMGELPREQRQAVAQVLYRGMAHADVAALAGVPLSTAKAWVRRGLQRLQACVGALDPDR